MSKSKTSGPSAKKAEIAGKDVSVASVPAVNGAATVSRRELWGVAVLCLLGAARIFFGSATVPFFADTDEGQHFDLVHKYARGYWPGGSKTYFDPEVVDLFIYDASPEFVNSIDRFPLGKVPPPPRTLADGPKKAAHIRSYRDYFHRALNQEGQEPPAYYALATAWYVCGKILGISPAATVYWTRFLNVLAYAALVAIAYAFARPYFGRDVAIATAALTAFFSNTVYFTVTNDVLCPLAGAAALLLLLRWYESECPSLWLGAAAGAVAALAVLVKLVNLPVLVAVGVVVLLRANRDRDLKKLFLNLWPLLLCTAVPLFLWGLRNRLLMGDWTGATIKQTSLGWKPKPLGEIFDHPIFTADGLVTFFKTLCISSFGGDSSWHSRPLHFVPGEVFFFFAAVIFPLVGLAAGLLAGKRDRRLELATAVCAIVFVTYVLELVALSIRFDFGNCPFPSPKFPYLANGRLMGGALVPFFALYAYGNLALFGRWWRPVLFAVAISVSIVMLLLTQWNYLKEMIHSPYNWFYL